MPLPYLFTPWLIRKIIKGGTTVQRILIRPEHVHHVSDHWISLSHYGSSNSSHFPLRIRVYMPEGEGPFPMVIFFHGGGWVICDLDTHDGICRYISIHANCVVVSVDYRLAPEFKFPVPVEDSYSAAVYICENASSFKGDPSRVCLAGDSAGGNLSIVCSQLAQIRNGPSFFCLATIYPSVEVRDVNYDSYDGKNIGLTQKDGDWYRNHYFLLPEDKCDPRASPIVTEELRGLPPTLIITGEHDRIRDPAEVYGQRLQMAGVSVTMKRFQGVGHGFLSTGAAPASEVKKQALVLLTTWIVNTFCGLPVPNTQPTDARPIYGLEEVMAATTLNQTVAPPSTTPQLTTIATIPIPSE